jgi:cell division cycle 20, cofactor of APC complex
MDDYYLNLLSWGPNNRIAVALNDTVYLWNAADETIDHLVTLEGDDYVSSVQFCTQGADNILAVGTSANTVQVSHFRYPPMPFS